MVEGMCPKCGEVGKLTKHHILPKRFFGYTRKVFILCRGCHSDLEKLIPQETQKEVMFYYKVIIQFLNEEK